MDFNLSEKQRFWQGEVRNFIDTEVRPAIPEYDAELASGKRWEIINVVERLKARAKAKGLWNLFIPPSAHETPEYKGAGITNLEYALCAEEMGRVPWASDVFNCAAPDTGNMEVLLRYGTEQQKARWLGPLLEGKIRSAFLMTEPAVASSDATNIQTSITRDGDDYVINGLKTWASGVGDPRCEIAIVMGRTNPTAEKHLQQSQVLVPLNTPGIKILRMLPIFGFDDAPHGHAEIELKNVRVSRANVILGEGRGFEVAQGRLGPGRIHHCMRIIGVAEEALRKMILRLQSRVTFGKPVIENSIWDERIARARIDIEMARLLCLKAADMMDKVGNKGAQLEIAMIKVASPRIALKIIDDAIQAHGGAGVSNDFGLGKAYARMRIMRIVDGPDEVHNRSIAKLEKRKYKATAPK